ncbi:hypothetical protein ACJRO7_035552 [Eucalyptus globulus]|uniref:Uncharacterized protein n=1 Tax=Eucalyptus globulus TaxID=34317 RepID=A0ABD3JC73_EUCGL
MQLHLSKPLFLSYLLTVALSCEAAPGEPNATTAPPLCNGLSGAAECLIAYQQPELELGAGPKFINTKFALNKNNAGCGRGKRYRPCVPLENQKVTCVQYNRHC